MKCKTCKRDIFFYSKTERSEVWECGHCAFDHIEINEKGEVKLKVDHPKVKQAIRKHVEKLKDIQI